MRTTIKRLNFLTSTLQAQMKEQGLLDPDFKLEIDHCHYGYRLNIIDENHCIPANGLLTQKTTKRGLESILESLVTVLDQQRAGYCEQEEYGQIYV
tara:strand:- start:495 stop:782 length:288 start_codon:yes stop_codon:yes gene_type:complete